MCNENTDFYLCPESNHQQFYCKKKKQKRKKDGSEKTEVNAYPQCLLPLLNSWREKNNNYKKKNALALQSGHSAPTDATAASAHHHPLYMPRSTCKQSIIHCYWLGAVGVRVQVPEAGRRFSHPSVPSHCASWLRQPSLGETAKTFPSDGEWRGGLWCSFEQSIPKTSSVELPFSHGQSLTAQERSVGDRLRMNSVYLAAAFAINSLSI